MTYKVVDKIIYEDGSTEEYELKDAIFIVFGMDMIY